MQSSDLYKRAQTVRPALPTEEFFLPDQQGLFNNVNANYLTNECNQPDRNDGDVLAGYSLERHATNIAAHLEENEALMENTLESEQLRKQTLKDMPQCLTVKRHIKRRLLKSVSQKSRRKPVLANHIIWLSFLSIFMAFQLQGAIKNFTYTFELWYNSLKTIEGHFGSGVATYFKFVRWLFLMNVFVMIFTLGFVVVPQIICDYYSSENTTSTNNEFSFEDIFTGDGYLSDTLLYFSHYSNQSLETIQGVAYNMPFAYFFTIIALFFCCFVLLSFSMASSYRRNFIETEGGLKNAYALKVFCGWDYSVATRKAADLKSSSLFLEMKELLNDAKMYSAKKSCLVVFWSRTIQVITNLFVTIALAGIGYLVWIYLERENSIRSAVVTPVIISSIVFLLPLVFTVMVKYEDYKNPRIALYITLARTFLLGAVVLGVLLVFWIHNASEYSCWGASFGEAIYRLILYDFLLTVLGGALLSILKYLLVVKIFKHSSGIEFDIAGSTLAIMYNQTLFWIGFFYAPLLSVMIVVKLFLIWYIQRTLLLHLCVPSSRSWRAAQTQTVFLILTFLSLLLVLAVHGYMIVEVEAPDCGPFSDHTYIYEIVVDGLLHLEQNSVFWKVLIYFTKPGVIALILIALCVRVYYLRAKAFAQKEMVNILREMLTWEARDKEFLLKHISKVTQGQWQYNLHRNSGDVGSSMKNNDYAYRRTMLKKYR